MITFTEKKPEAVEKNLLQSFFNLVIYRNNHAVVLFKNLSFKSALNLSQSYPNALIKFSRMEIAQ